ncbi:unnamed protein product [Didymodactylos carnosus]|uniref:Uncharacterized protein n=1 Tax=Didymodactylos carnosus TaxID=1234261 RepID=A0A815BEB4_9BILA|nr:unnamed protein product [Didymodactylos carnosus]CAF1269213.1 unnamed protein product [Didymodactylos carnosus]CAF4011024.1 unnamed protein product [Didymodactylos carnosus]CAF4055653.1 unnamed protein product [Didymodactylos carnosus]
MDGGYNVCTKACAVSGLSCKKEFKLAIQYYQANLDIQKRLYPETHTNFGTTYSNIDIMYIQMSKWKDAEDYVQKALHLFDKTLPANHSHILLAKDNLYLTKNRLHRVVVYREKERDRSI